MTETRERALELLERHITSGREGNDDPAATARECMVALEGLGYRPTEARPVPSWKPRSTTGTGMSEAIKAEVEAAKQVAAEAAARFREDEQDGAA